MDASLIKPLLKSLLDNTKDKNTTVRAQSEHTIVNLLRLRQEEEFMQVVLLVYCWLEHMNEISALKLASRVNFNHFFFSAHQSITAILDSASNELLSECHRRSLKKIASLPDSNEEIDDTILT